MWWMMIDAFLYVANFQRPRDCLLLFILYVPKCFALSLIPHNSKNSPLFFISIFSACHLFHINMRYFMCITLPRVLTMCETPLINRSIWWHFFEKLTHWTSIYLWQTELSYKYFVKYESASFRTHNCFHKWRQWIINKKQSSVNGCSL